MTHRTQGYRMIPRNIAAAIKRRLLATFRAARNVPTIQPADKNRILDSDCPPKAQPKDPTIQPADKTRLLALQARGDFAAAEALVLAGLERFPHEPWLLARYGDFAMRRRDWPEAARRWALMRERCPQHPHGYKGGAAALKEQGDLAGADALLLAGLRRFPDDPWLLAEYGDTAMRRQDWPEAWERWALMRARCPEHPRGCVGAAAVLKEQGDWDGAEAFALEALEKFPEEPGLYAEYGDIAMRRGDWVEAARRWRSMRETCPTHPRGYKGGAAALKALGDFAGADALVLAGLRECPDDLWLYAEYGDIAMRQGDWMEADKRWALLREKYPKHPRGYVGGAEALRQAGDFVGAHRLLRQGLEAAPLDPQLTEVAANIGPPPLVVCESDEIDGIDEAFWRINASRPSVTAMIAFLSRYDVISFDIFDTALFRTVDLPQDIFAIMAAEMRFNDFMRVRRQAESRARSKQQRTLGHREVTLDNIWTTLETEYGISRHWQDREIELELTHSVPNPYISTIYKALLEAGKTLVFMTDMYLPRQVIEQLLEQAGYRAYDQLLLSNEQGLCKGNGTLQPMLSASYPGKTIVHVGDNFRADVEKTRQAGIDALYNADQRRLRSAYDSGAANRGASLYRAVINNTMHNGMPLDRGLHYEHGFRVGGILAAGYCAFINETARRHQCDKIIFCARDGEILHRIYNAYYHEFDNIYAAISRHAILGVTGKRYFHDYIGRSILRHIKNGGNSATLAEIFTESGFDFLIDRLEEHDIEKYLFPQNLPIAKIEEFLYAEQETILRQKERNVRAARRYFADMIGASRKLLVVDVGWTGTCIAALSSFLATELPELSLDVHGTLLCTSRNEAITTEIADDTITAYLYSPFENLDITRFFMEGRRMTTEQRDLVHMPLEYLFTSTEASLIDYDLDDKGNVLLRRTAFSPQNADEIRAMQDGMFDFCGMFRHYADSSRIPVPISPYLASGPLREAIRNRAYCRAVYGNFHYDATFPLFGDIGKRTFFRDLFPPEPAPETQAPPAGEAAEANKAAKRVLFVSPEMIYAGAPRSLLRIATVAQEAGYGVEVWTAKPGPFMREFAERGIRTRVVDEAALDKDEIKQRIDTFAVAVCNTIVTDAYVRALSRRIPVAWYIREAGNIPDFCMAVPRRLETLRTSRGIVCVSDYAARAVRRFTDMPVRVTPNAVEDEADRALPHVFARDGKVRFIQMGTLEYRKGYDLFIRACKTLPEEYRNRVELFFAGGFINSGAPFASYVLGEIQGEQNIHFLGQIRDNRRKVEIMSQMDVVVAASRDESCSLVVLEGAMLSKPLIVTEQVGAKYMVNGRNGLIIQSGSVPALRAAFMDLVDRRDQLEDMGRVSRVLYEEKAGMAAHRRDIVALLEETMTNAPAEKQTERPGPPKRPSPAAPMPRERIVVSLTSHPPRIRTAARAAASLLRQTRPADRVVLWLARDQFPAGNDELPEELLRLADQGLEIAWCDEDLKPHKKYWHAMREEPEASVICVDDDVTYNEHLVETLCRCRLEHPHAVVCMRANLMLFRPDGAFRRYDNWIYDYRGLKNTPSYALLPTGVGGVLYPPRSVPQAAFAPELVMTVCPSCDDLWLKIMTTLNGYPAVLTPTIYDLPAIEGTQHAGLWTTNTMLGGNDEALAAILDHIETTYGLREPLMRRLRGIGKAGEWLGPDSVEYAVPVPLLRRA